MIDRIIPVMPKTALIVLLLIQGNFIPTGENAELCPKYPLGVSNSISGIVIGTIITSEKIVNGFFSYFYYLGENTVIQLINNHDKLHKIIFKYTNKIQGFFTKVVDGIVEQYQSIYGASSGIFKSIIDSSILLENSLQSYVYSKTSKLVSLITSGQITAKIAEQIKNPVQATVSAINSVKSALFSFVSQLKATLIGGASSFNGEGYINKIKEALVTPFKATKELLQNSTIILKSVTGDSVAKLKGFLHELETGSLTEKISASLASPNIAIKEAWSLIAQLTNSVKSSISITAVALVEPLLGSTLTRQLSKLTKLPFDITLGVWNTVKSWAKKLDDFTAAITGGGSLSVRINFVLAHPLDTLKNSVSTTVNATESITRFFLGDKATNILVNVLKSPLTSLNDLISAITGGGNLSEKLNAFITKPVEFLKGAWSSLTGSIQNITKSILGGKLTLQITNILKAPGQFVNDLVFSITGGGSFSEVITNIFRKPLATLKNIWNGSVSSIKSFTQTIFGANFTANISKIISYPVTLLNQIISSLPGGGSLTIKITSPITTLKSIWRATIGGLKSLMFGGSASGGGAASAGGSAEGSAGGSVSVSGKGGFGAAISSLLQSPGKILQSSLTALKNTENSVVGGIKGILKHIPIIGGSFKGGISVNYGGSASAGGGGKGSGGGGADTRGDSSSQGGGGGGGAISTGGSFSIGGS